MSKTDVGPLLSPCCKEPIETLWTFEEIMCSKCYNTWDGDGRFVSY